MDYIRFDAANNLVSAIIAFGCAFFLFAELSGNPNTYLSGMALVITLLGSAFTWQFFQAMREYSARAY